MSDYMKLHKAAEAHKRTDKPLPCPKCGQEVIIHDAPFFVGYWEINCEHCGELTKVRMPTRRQAIAAWNAGVKK